MNRYADTIHYLYSQLPMFQRVGPAAYKNTLDNALALDRMYGFPHRNFKTIHVAGTNGKGSVSHMLAAVLQSAGYKTGLYTSPHLKDFRERIRIDGQMIPENSVIDWVDDFRKRNTSLEPSFFELTVAMAFDYFAREKADIAVVETGLGGRLDSTNIISPEVSVITNIGYDHTALLGETLPEIAVEKAGIIKHGTPIVVGRKQPETCDVFVEKAREQNAPLFFAENDWKIERMSDFSEINPVYRVTKNNISSFITLDLPGIYQHENLCTVLKTIDILKEKGWPIPKPTIAEGLSNVRNLTGLQGRWQVLGTHPLIVCDTGHNEDGIQMVAAQMKMMKFDKLYIVFGVVNDKEPDRILAQLPVEARYYFCQADLPRAMNPENLRLAAEKYGLRGEIYSSVKEAFAAAKHTAGTEDFIFIGGSTFVVAEIL